VPLSIDVLSTLADGLAGVRIGLLDEGFAEAEPEVKELVLAAVDVLQGAGASVRTITVPEHHHVRYAHEALMAEGALALFNSSYFAAFTRTYYPADVIAALNTFWSAHADVLAPRSKLQLIAAQLSRRNYAGRVYAKAQNVRPTYIRAYNTALADVDVLVMPTTLTTAPKVEPVEGGYMEVLDHSLRNRLVAAGLQYRAVQFHRAPGAGHSSW